MATAYLSLGSNIDAMVHMRAARLALSERFGDVRVSPVYVTPAVGFNGADFHNAAAVITTDLDPVALNAWLHALEDAQCRDRSGPRFGDRTLDIDIVLYDDDAGHGVVMSGVGNLQLPRDDLQHAFVLKPLADIAPNVAVAGDGRTLQALWHAHRDVDGGFATVEW